jgi:hypothetical protein
VPRVRAPVPGQTGRSRSQEARMRPIADLRACWGCSPAPPHIWLAPRRSIGALVINRGGTVFPSIARPDDARRGTRCHIRFRTPLLAEAATYQAGPSMPREFKSKKRSVLLQTCVMVWSHPVRAIPLQPWPSTFARQLEARAPAGSFQLVKGRQGSQAPTYMAGVPDRMHGRGDAHALDISATL